MVVVVYLFREEHILIINEIDLVLLQIVEKNIY